MQSSTELFNNIQDFFQDYLCAQRGVSINTVKAYRDALKIYLNFVAEHTDKNISRLHLDDFSTETTLAFLKDIEKRRKNSAVTRNLRLAALRTFFSFLSSKDPTRIGEYQRILHIPLKKSACSSVSYLEVPEVACILDLIDRTASFGERDYVLLNLLYNTGARVQELCDLRVESAHLTAPAYLTVTGKGQKSRLVPLWNDVAQLLSDFLEQNNLHLDPKAHIFQNCRGEPIGRYGIRYIVKKRVQNAIPHCPSLSKKKVSPHTFRHTTALHLLQAGVDLSVIRSWLGHVSISTTHGYVEIDLEMKRKALNAGKRHNTTQQLNQIIAKNKDIISWLESL